jgi:Flp pilus assembly protein TadG
MKLKELFSDTSGAAVVEFAIAVPYLVILIFGILGFGLLMYTQAGLQHSVEVAARCGAVNQFIPPAFQNPKCNSTAHVQTYAQAQYWGLAPTPSFVANAPANNCTSNCCYSVQVGTGATHLGYTFAFLGDAFPGVSVTLNAQACYPVQIQ